MKQKEENKTTETEINKILKWTNNRENKINQRLGLGKHQ